MADDYLYAGEDEDEDPMRMKKLQKVEAAFHAICLKMYPAESEVCRQARQHGLDGIDVPRFISDVRVPISYLSKNCSTECSSVQGVPGMFIQYLPGFELIDLAEDISPATPISKWRHIVDEAVSIVEYMTTQMYFCNTDCHPRNTVVHWDPILEGWKCKVIDFGHCKIKRHGISDWDWRKTQAWANKEANIGREMQVLFRRHKGSFCMFEPSQHYMDLQDEFYSESADERMAALKLE